MLVLVSHLLKLTIASNMVPAGEIVQGRRRCDTDRGPTLFYGFSNS